MKKSFLLLSLVLLSFSLISQNFYYDDLSTIEYQFLELGMGLPFKSFPYSGDEMRSYHESIDPSDLSDTGKIFYKSNLDQLEKKYLYSEPDGFQFDSGVEIVAEGFYHHNLSNNFEFSSRDYIWQYGYEERHPLIHIPLEAKILDMLYVQTGITVKEEHMTVNCRTEDTASDNNFNLFDPDSPALDLYFPFQAVASLGGEHWNVQLGRDQLSWGNGQTGNLILSDYSDFYDYLLVNTWWDNFKFSTVYIVMDEYSPRDVEPADDPDGEPDDIGYQAFIGHRFDMRFFRRLNISLVEAVTYTGEPFLFKDLNSLMAYHNWTTPSKINSILSLEFEYIPWKYFYFYGQLAMDEFATKYEEEGDGGGGQSTWAWLAGIKGAYPLGPGYIHGNFELVHTDPLLYHRRKPPYFYNVRKIWSLVTDSYEYIVKPIGHEAGPDAKLWHFEAGYKLPSGISGSIGLDYLIQGETTIYDEYNKTEELVTPTGTAETVILFHLGLESGITDYLSTGIDLYYIDVSDFNHIEGQKTSDMEISGYLKFTI